MEKLYTHPITNIAKLIAFILAWVFFGWKLALIVSLLTVEVTA